MSATGPTGTTDLNSVVSAVKKSMEHDVLVAYEDMKTKASILLKANNSGVATPQEVMKARADSEEATKKLDSLSRMLFELYKGMGLMRSYNPQDVRDIAKSQKV